MIATNIFVRECKKQGTGDIIEFGTFTGNSTKFLAENWKAGLGNIFTVDGWEGLPKSLKELPSNGFWDEGAFTGNKLEVERLLAPYNHVTMIDSWINELNPPETYKIGPIVGANIDVDIYESTIDSLEYLLRCEWVNNEIIIRFDDWDHPSSEELRKQVAQHNKLAWSDFLQKYPNFESTLLHKDPWVAIFKLKK